MKQTFLSLILFSLIVFVLAGCKQKEKPADETDSIMVTKFDYSDSDSLEINTLCSQYANYLANRDLQSASAMLYTYHNDSIFPLTDEMRQGYLSAMGSMPIVSCSIDSIDLRSFTNNRVRIALTLLPDMSLPDEKTMVMINVNPVKVQGHWFLTIFDKYAEGVDRYHDNDY